MNSNKQRVIAVDIARGLAVLFMICVHCLITFSTPEVLHSIFGMIIAFLGSPPAAPVFMTAMGISSYYSKNPDIQSNVRRGLWIIFLGYVLNFFRGVAPVFLANIFSPAMAARIPKPVANYYDAFFELDILHFAGLSLMVMAVLKSLKIHKSIFLVMAFVIALVSPMLWGKGADVPVIGHLLDYLWGNKPSTEHCIGNLVSFPFFPWFVYPLVGMFLGDTLTHSNNYTQTFNRIGLWGVLVLIAGTMLTATNFRYQIGDYYHARIGGILFSTGIVLIFFYLCNLIAERIKMNRLSEILFYWSKHVNSLYMIQWILIMAGAVGLLGFNRSSYFMTIIAMLSTMVLTQLINDGYLSLKNRPKPVLL